MLFTLTIYKILKSAINELHCICWCSLFSATLVHLLDSIPTNENEPPCLLLENLVVVWKNSACKLIDEGENSGMKDFQENCVKVWFTIDSRMSKISCQSVIHNYYRMGKISPQWILHSALLDAYAWQLNCDGHPHPLQLSENHAIKQREFNVNSEKRKAQQTLQLIFKRLWNHKIGHLKQTRAKPVLYWLTWWRGRRSRSACNQRKKPLCATNLFSNYRRKYIKIKLCRRIYF